MKLYEIANDYLALLQAIDEGEIPEEAIADTLEAIEGEIEFKADNLACVLKTLNYADYPWCIRDYTYGNCAWL